MPTSGESGIHPSSTYNLRSRPLPKASAGTGRTRAEGNKENVKGAWNSSTATRSTKKPAQSKIPLANNKSRLPIPRSAKTGSSSSSSSSSSSKSSKPLTPRKKVPDFEKLHKSWTKKFQQGKAVAKKPCTQLQAFDLTRPGTKFKSGYFDGSTEKKESRVARRRQTGFPDVPDEFTADEGALQSILNGDGIVGSQRNPPASSSRVTLAGTGCSSRASRCTEGKRQTLGHLPTTSAGRVNNPSNILSAKRVDARSVGRKSLLQEQKDAGIDFETSADALASILNNTGLNTDRKSGFWTGRQTIAGMSAKQRQSGGFNMMSSGRTSIYYQRPKNQDVNKVYSEFAKRTLSRFTMDGDKSEFKSALIDSLLPDNRGSIYIKRDMPPSAARGVVGAAADTCRASAAITPGRAGVSLRGKTPGTASRVPNPRFQAAQSRQELSCSPSLKDTRSAVTPARRIPTTPGGQSQKNVRWADVLSTPPDRDQAATEMTAKDVVAVLNFGDELEDQVCPETKSRLKEVEKLEADTVANRQKLTEMEEIEKQLEMEIARLHESEAVEEIPLEPARQSSTHPVLPLGQGGFSVQQQNHGLFELSRVDQEPVKQPVGYIDPVRLPRSGNIPIVLPLPQGSTYDPHTFQASYHQDQRHPEEAWGMHKLPSQGQQEFVSDDHQPQRPQHSDMPQQIPLGVASAGSGNYANADARTHVNQVHVPSSEQRAVLTAPNSCSGGLVESNLNNVTTGRGMNELQMAELDEKYEGENLGFMALDNTEAFRGVLPSFLESPTPFQKPAKENVPYSQSKSDVLESQQHARCEPSLVLDRHDKVSAAPHLRQAMIEVPEQRVSNNIAFGVSSARPVRHDNIQPRFTPAASATLLQNLTQQEPHRSLPTSLPFSRSHTASIEPKQQYKVHQSVNVPVNYSTDNTSSRSISGYSTAEGDRASHATVPAVPLLQTPTPLRVRGAPYMRSRTDARSISTPLQYSGSMVGLPPPLQTPLSMRNTTAPLHHQTNQDQPNFGGSSLLVSPVVMSTTQSNQEDAQSIPVTSNQLPHGYPSNHHQITSSALQQQHPYRFHSQPYSSAPVLNGQTQLVSDPRSMTPAILATQSQPMIDAVRSEHVQSAQPSHTHAVLPSAAARTDNPSPWQQPPVTVGVAATTVVSSSWSRPGLSQGAGLQGSLALSSSLRTSGHQDQTARVSRLITSEREASGQLFHQVLLDEECALYACRLKGRFTPQPLQPRPLNPVANVLLNGDEMHFVPLTDVDVLVASPTGSAFSNYVIASSTR